VNRLKNQAGFTELSFDERSQDWLPTRSVLSTGPNCYLVAVSGDNCIGEPAADQSSDLPWKN